ncbi:MAG: hypothetical protein RIB67_07185 [Miltoncostaeaceae bacterium]
MGFTDKLKDTVQKGKDAAQKAVDEGREKASELSMKRKFNSSAEELGILIFRHREGETGLDADIERVLGEMRETAKELDALDPD